MNKNDLFYDLFDYPLISQLKTPIPELLKKLETTDKFKYDPHLCPLLDNKTLFGIEVEVENINYASNYHRKLTPFWGYKEDGSLKNHGMEFVSVPLSGKHLHLGIQWLYWLLNSYDSKYDFSERTSIHVHMNIRDISLNDLAAFLLVYIISEEYLFNYVESVGRSRRHNIFCVPVKEGYTILKLKNLFRFHTAGVSPDAVMEHLVASWRKYSALNLITIKSFGTIEFRHLCGTADVKSLYIWINMISKLKKYVVGKSFEEITSYIFLLNTNSGYEAFMQSVFEEFYNYLGRIPQRIVEDSVIAVKDIALAAKMEVNNLCTLDKLAKSSLINYVKKL